MVTRCKREATGIKTKAIAEEIERTHVIEREILNECSELLCLARFSCSEKYNHRLFTRLRLLRDDMEAEATKLVEKETSTKSMYLCGPSLEGIDMISQDVTRRLVLASVGGI